MTRRTGHISWLIAVAVILIATSVISLAITSQHTYRLQRFLEQSYWAAAQTESEFLRLQNALSLHVADPSRASYEDVRLKLDILFSRIDVVYGGSTDDVAGGKESIEAFVREMRNFLDRLDALTADPAFGDSPAGEEAVRIMDAQWIALHEWVRGILHGDLWQEDRREIVRRQELIIAVNAALGILSIAIVVGISGQSRRLRSLVSREAWARAKADQASAARDRFIAGMSHELRTPLNAIIGFCDLLKMGLHGRLTKKQVNYVSDISASGAYLLSLINDILEYSKLEARMHDPEITRIDLRSVVEEGMSYIEPTLAAQGGSVDLRCPEGPVWINADRRIALQCVINLLSNAAKHSPKNERIEIDVIPVGDSVRLSIRDHGPGMTKEDLAAAFEPFKQSGDPYTSKSVGPGMGLPLTQSFCQVMDAKFNLEPKEIRGLLATIDFRRADPDERPRPFTNASHQAA